MAAITTANRQHRNLFDHPFKLPVRRTDKRHVTVNLPAADTPILNEGNPVRCLAFL